MTIAKLLLNILQGLLTAANALFVLLHNKQLISAGRYAAIGEHAQKLVDNVKKASNAARAVDPDDPLYDDGYARRVRSEFTRTDE